MKFSILVLVILSSPARDIVASTTNSGTENGRNERNPNDEMLELLHDIKQDMTELRRRNREQGEKLVQVSRKLSVVERKLANVVSEGEESSSNTQILPRPILGPFPIPQQENCWIRVNNTCYWAEVHLKEDINYDKALTICGDQNSEIGHIPDLHAYQQITRYLQTLIPESQIRASVLFGLRVDIDTHEVFPPTYYTKWKPSFPKSRYGYNDASFVYVIVSNETNDPAFGMANGGPDWDYQGVLCQVPSQQNLYQNPTLKLEYLDTFHGTENCDVKINSTCYWAEIRSNGKVKYSRAETICGENGSKVGQIPDLYTYEHITDYLRTQIPITETSSLVWIDLRVEQGTGHVLPTDYYTRWTSTSPRTGYGYKEATYSFLYIDRFINALDQGMMNYDYNKVLDGVLCQKMTQPDNPVVKSLQTENCDIRINSTCFWAEIHLDEDVKYQRAEQICGENGSKVGRIPDIYTYEHVMSYLRTKIPPTRTSSLVWFDLRVKPTTGAVLPTNHYVRWTSNSPRTGYRYDDATYSFLYVEIFPNYPNQGMLNYDYNKLLNGVLCQKTQSGITTIQSGDENCDGGLLIDRKCYWAAVHKDNIIKRERAAQICNDENSSLGQISDKQTYEQVMNYLRTKVPPAETESSVWTGLTIELRSEEVKPFNSYTRWSPSYPSTRYHEDVFVYLLVEIFVDDPVQGMRNGDSRDAKTGVLCQKNI